MKKTIIAITFTLISIFGLSQHVTLHTKFIYGKDTITLKKGQSITNALDSINKTRFAKYYAEQKRIEDSIQLAYEKRIKEGPHLYYNSIDKENGKIYIETELDPEVVVKIIDSLKFQKVDSIITYSDMAYEVLKEINPNLNIDTIRQEVLSEDMIHTYYLKKDVAILQKDIYEKCPSECYKEVFRRISKKKKLMKILRSENIEYINLCILEDQRSVTTFIYYKEKDKEERYEIVYIR